MLSVLNLDEIDKEHVAQIATGRSEGCGEEFALETPFRIEQLLGKRSHMLDRRTDLLEAVNEAQVGHAVALNDVATQKSNWNGRLRRELEENASADFQQEGLQTVSKPALLSKFHKVTVFSFSVLWSANGKANENKRENENGNKKKRKRHEEWRNSQNGRNVGGSERCKGFLSEILVDEVLDLGIKDGKIVNETFWRTGLRNSAERRSGANDDVLLEIEEKLLLRFPPYNLWKRIVRRNKTEQGRRERERGGTLRRWKRRLTNLRSGGNERALRWTGNLLNCGIIGRHWGDVRIALLAELLACEQIRS
jgi:hypothetical protein